MLHRSLRGREASVALSAGEVKPMVYGESRGAADGLLPGIEFLTKRGKAQMQEDGGEDENENEDEEKDADDNDEDDDENDGQDDSEDDADDDDLNGADGDRDDEDNGEGEGEESEEDDGEESEEETDEDAEQNDDASGRTPAASSTPKKAKLLKKRVRLEADVAKKLVTEEVLSSEDFKRMRKMQLKQSVALQLGGKRKADEAFGSESEGSSGSDSEDEDAPRRKDEDPWDVCRPDSLKGMMIRKKGKQARLARVMEGRPDRKEMMKKRRERGGGSTNKEKRRNKPLMMHLKSRAAREKKFGTTAGQKVNNLKQHIKNLQKKTGGKMKRRRGG